MRFPDDAASVVPILLLAALGAFALAAILTPIVRRLARHLDVLDTPDHRRVNTRPIPRGGGIAVAASFLLVAVVVLTANDSAGWVTRPLSIGATELVALLAGGLAAAIIGFLDDYFQLRARWQFVGQVVLAGVAVALGIEIAFINNPFGSGIIVLSGVFAAGFTMFWIVGMINSINFIDGLDGLSSGIALIASVTLGIISLTTSVDQPYVAILCFVLAGSLLGFLIFNFHPASIFVGTSGVMFIGYTLALLSILGTAKIAVALLVLGVPIIDTFWIIVRRVSGRRSPFAPDRGHIHHRLLDLGLSHTQTVLVIYAVCIGLAVLSFLLSGTGQLYTFLGIVLVSGIGLLVLTRRIDVAASKADVRASRERRLDDGTSDDKRSLPR